MNYQPITNDQYRAGTFALLGQMEGIETLPYYDPDDVATIGVGFNIEEDNVLRAVMFRMGFSLAEIDDDTPSGYRAQFVAACNGTPQTNVALQSRLDAIMAARDDASQTGRRTFNLTIAEMELVFNDLRPDYENEITRWSSTIDTASANSYERIALFSLGYNQQTIGASELLGNGLRTAILANDRAEACTSATPRLKQLGPR